MMRIKGVATVMELVEKRNWPRLKTELPVSLKCLDMDSLSQSWHVGEILDVSLNGMMILCETLGNIPLASSVEILCFPQDKFPPYETVEPEPVWLTGVVAWQDRAGNRIGLHLDS